jgi:hypothetical protein
MNAHSATSDASLAGGVGPGFRRGGRIVLGVVRLLDDIGHPLLRVRSA